MSSLNLKPTHKVVKAYYEELAKLEKHGASAEGAVAPLFAAILRYCAHQFRWIFQEKYAIQLGEKTIYPDGALRDDYFLYGIWEAKSSKVDLEKEIKNKFDTGYPQENILFQTPYRAVLWQNGERVTDCNISEPETLVDVLKQFFEFRRPEYDKWKVAVSQFGDNVKTIGRELLDLITPEYHKNKEFARAFDEFFTLCKQSINPNLSKQAVEKMLVQHLMTERIFNRVFYDNTFVDRNVIASEIKKVILVLTSRYLNLHEFLRRLDPFYQVLESTAASIHDFSQKQTFLNTVYEKFFQEFSEKEADTHGIVYTPQPIVHFIVNSVEEILQKEFGRSLSDEGVHILDPFVGTGNFIIHVMQKIKRTALSDKYEKELHCNEVMLLPYYIASMNIEHEYYTVTGEYKSFEGICFVDTFELAEKQQAEFGFMTEKNTERVNRQKAAPIFVILGNPPYNAGQVNENDNNKNRKYEEMDRRIRETYARDSQATNKNALSDVYVKAIKWASDRIKENGEGIVAFVTNNGFIDGVAFDGMRKHLTRDFSKIYHIDLKGNARTAGERRRREGGNIFDDAIRVGVGITFFVRKKDTNAQSEIYLYSVDDYWKAMDKKGFLEDAKSFTNVQMKRIIPDNKHSWLTEGMGTEFEAFIPIGTKEAKTSNQQTNEVLFKLFSNGNDSGRDRWVYNFNRDEVLKNAKLFADTYNSEVDRWFRSGQPNNMDEFVISDEKRIKWTRNAKRDLKRGRYAEFSPTRVRNALYHPFTHQYLYYGKIFNKEVALFPLILPTFESESENCVICVPGLGNRKRFGCLMTNLIPLLDLAFEKIQCFPFYTYDEDGSNRRENITDWALEQFRAHYSESTITKWNIFYYVYGILHHPQYREKYAKNLKRELPRIPFVKSPFGGGQGEVFRAFVEAGKQLVDLHVNYGEQPEYPLEMIENPLEPLNWRVEKMKLSKDNTQIIYNNFLTLGGIPPEAFEYRLGNRSALEWIIDQYRVKTDKRSGITNDPNREDDPRYIVRLIKKVVTVSVETVKIVKDLPEIGEEASA